MRTTAIAAAVAAAALAAGLTGTASAAPCKAHEGEARKVCKAQSKRNAMSYPPNPSWREATARVSAYDLATAKRVSACEEPGTEHGTGRSRSPWPRYWSLSGGPGSYVSGFGMAHSTYLWAAKATGYPEPPAATPAMQLLVAVNGAHLFGWSGWGCFG